MQRQLQQKLLNDLLAFQNVDEADEGTRRLQKIILEQAKRRAYSLLDLDRRLPFAENGGEEIGRFFSLIQDRNTEGTATDLEQALFLAKTAIDNPGSSFDEGALLEEIITMSHRLLAC